MAQDISDEDIFRFALNLEYMEAEYYLRGTTEQGISAEDAGSGAGEVVGGHEVPFELDPIAGSLRNWPRMNSPMFATTVRHSEAMRWIGRPSISTPNSPP